MLIAFGHLEDIRKSHGGTNGNHKAFIGECLEKLAHDGGGIAREESKHQADERQGESNIDAACDGPDAGHYTRGRLAAGELAPRPTRRGRSVQTT